ncbi:unnamed protein product, partial [Iphiclides podalirius]
MNSTFFLYCSHYKLTVEYVLRWRRLNAPLDEVRAGCNAAARGRADPEHNRYTMEPVRENIRTDYRRSPGVPRGA